MTVCYLAGVCQHQPQERQFRVGGQESQQLWHHDLVLAGDVKLLQFGEDSGALEEAGYPEPVA